MKHWFVRTRNSNYELHQEQAGIYWMTTDNPAFRAQLVFLLKLPVEGERMWLQPVGKPTSETIITSQVVMAGWTAH